MLALFISLNAHNFPIFQVILMILVSKFMVHRALSDKTYLSLGLLSPLTLYLKEVPFNTFSNSADLNQAAPDEGLLCLQYICSYTSGPDK